MINYVHFFYLSTRDTNIRCLLLVLLLRTEIKYEFREIVIQFFINNLIMLLFETIEWLKKIGDDYI